jgi:hypothetical protein
MQPTSRLLVSGATAAIRRISDDPQRAHLLDHLGHLMNPRSRNSMGYLFSTGLPVAADNDCFQGLDRVRYLAMLRRLYSRDVAWVTAPDVVANADATLARFRIWRPVLDYYKLPIAFVVQDGQEDRPVPWGAIRCLFIGGSTAWKEGPHAARLMREAHDREKWVHVGRVNTLRRRWLVGVFDFDSIDGSCFSRFSDKYIPWMASTLMYKQHGMEDLLCTV